MRSNRDLRLALLLALACAGATVALRAQESPPAAPPVAAPAEDAASGPAADEDVIKFPDAPDPGATPASPAPAVTPPAAAPAAGTAPAMTAPGENDAADEEEPPADSKPRTPGVVGPTPGHFEPTEKVRADFDVSFPVDI